MAYGVVSAICVSVLGALALPEPSTGAHLAIAPGAGRHCSGPRTSGTGDKRGPSADPVNAQFGVKPQPKFAVTGPLTRNRQWIY